MFCQCIAVLLVVKYHSGGTCFNCINCINLILSLDLDYFLFFIVALKGHDRTPTKRPHDCLIDSIELDLDLQLNNDYNSYLDLDQGD